MRYYLFLIVVHFTTNLFGQCNPAIPPKEIKSYPIKRISLLTEKETAYEIVKREIKASDKIIKVYEIETWQPNNKVAKTIIANVITKFDDSLTIDKLLLYSISTIYFMLPFTCMRQSCIITTTEGKNFLCNRE